MIAASAAGELREGPVDGRSKPRPGFGPLDVVIPTYGNLWRAASGSTLRLELTNVESPYITPSRVPSATTVTGVRLRVPVR